MRKHIPKFSSLLFRIGQFIRFCRNGNTERKRKNSIRKWIANLNRSKTDVLIGTNFGKTNGIDFHIHAIQRYSGLKIELMPSDEMMRTFNPYDFEVKYNGLIKNLNLNNIQAIHSHVYPWFIHWCRELQLSKGTRWLHTYHLPYLPEHSMNELSDWQLEFNQVWETVASQADIKISVSKWQQEYYKRNYNIETIYIPNGVDVQLCDQADGMRFKEKIGFDHYILNVSRHDPVKNPGEFIRLAQMMPEYKFVMIGPDLSVEILKSEYGVFVPENVLIFGPASHEVVQDAIAACSVLVSTSKREGLPTLILEGMAHSKPVVVSNEPGSMEAIGNGEFGYFYEPGNVGDLKQKAISASNDQEIGLKARRRVLEEYDWRVVAEKLDRIYTGTFSS